MSLRARNLGRRLGGRWVIRGCNLDVEDGRWLGILGPIGAGKTTLLRLLATVVTPDEGALFWRGMPVGQGSALRANLGYLPQAFALPALPTVADALVYLATLKGIPAGDQQAACAYALDWVEGDGLADRPPQQLSTGMTRRVGMAQAILGGPSVLVLDEPDAAADPVYRRTLIERLRSLADGGCAVITATNDPALLEAADAVLLLDRGRPEGIFELGAFRRTAEDRFGAADSGPNSLEDAYAAWRGLKR